MLDVLLLIFAAALLGLFLWLLLMWSPSPSADAAMPHPVVEYLTKCARRLAILFRICFLIAVALGFGAMTYLPMFPQAMIAVYLFLGLAGVFVVLVLASSACSEA